MLAAMLNDPRFAGPLFLALAFALIALGELWHPARAAHRARRWPLNLALGLVSMLLGRLAAAAAPLAIAHWAAAAGFGLFNSGAIAGLGVSGAALLLTVAFTIIAMDFAIYWQHRAMHAWRWGWLLHRLHHADRGFDVSTGVRFNPAEAAVSLLYKGAVVALLGAPPLAVLLFEVYLACFSMVEHANIRLPARLDAVLRRFWVTPAVHSIHHSAHGDDHNHNYGFAIGVWDRMFGTYADHASGPIIGLPQPTPAG